jgi:hypothetical protein
MYDIKIAGTIILLYYSYENSVVGFLNASFTGFEQGPGHSVPVGYLKGGTIAGQNLVFDVRSTQGTASEFVIRFYNIKF